MEGRATWCPWFAVRCSCSWWNWLLVLEQLQCRPIAKETKEIRCVCDCRSPGNWRQLKATEVQTIWTPNVVQSHERQIWSLSPLAFPACSALRSGLEFRSCWSPEPFRPSPARSGWSGSEWKMKKVRKRTFESESYEQSFNLKLSSRNQIAVERLKWTQRTTSRIQDDRLSRFDYRGQLANSCKEADWFLVEWHSLYQRGKSDPTRRRSRSICPASQRRPAWVSAGSRRLESTQTLLWPSQTVISHRLRVSIWDYDEPVSDPECRARSPMNRHRRQSRALHNDDRWAWSRSLRLAFRLRENCTHCHRDSRPDGTSLWLSVAACPPAADWEREKADRYENGIRLLRLLTLNSVSRFRTSRL